MYRPKSRDIHSLHVYQLVNKRKVVVAWLTLAPTSNPRAVTTLTLSHGRSRGQMCRTITRMIFQPFSFGDLSWITFTGPLNNRTCSLPMNPVPSLHRDTTCNCIYQHTCTTVVYVHEHRPPSVVWECLHMMTCLSMYMHVCTCLSGP